MFHHFEETKNSPCNKQKMEGVRLTGPLDGLFRAFTLADGSCFFHSLAAALDAGSYALKPWKTRRAIGLELRRRLVGPKVYRNWLVANGYEEFGGLTPEEAGDPSVFADDILISFCAQRLGLTLIIIRNKKEAYVRYPKQKNSSIILMAYVNDNHFEPILRECETQQLTHEFDRTVFASPHLHTFDSPHVKRLKLLKC
jgi:hypothetical protein